MANAVVSANPHGELNLAELDAFEKALGCSLPDSYRSYLIQFNGGKFKNDIVPITDDATRIHHMYGLHKGPEYSRLLIGRPPDLSRDYLAICDDAFGNHFLIKLRGDSTGGIFFIDYEENDSSHALIPIADNFAAFVERMTSEDKRMAEFRRRDPAGYAEFQNRLREMKRLRAEELKKDK